MDLIVVGVIVLAFFVSARKGLVKSVWKIAALIITIALVTALKTPMVNYLSETTLYDKIHTSISDRLSLDDYHSITENDENTADEGDEKFFVPEFIVKDMIKSGEMEVISAMDNGADVLAQKLTDLAIQIIATVALFIIIRIFLMAAFMVLDGMSKLPLINQANALLGGLLGVVNILAVIYIACALLSLFAKSEVVGLIEQSYIVKYFYNYNILLQLIMKI